MENNHLTYFKVENFKKFESLEVNDIGQFNLIVGDNNVGKTCLLEALLFDEDGQQMLNNFYISLTKRGFKFQIEEITKKIGNLSSTETIIPKGNYFKEYIFGQFSNEVIFKYVVNNLNQLNQGRKRIDLKIDEQDNGKKLSRPVVTSLNIPWEEYVKQFVFFTVNYDKQPELFWIFDYNENILNFPLISFNDTPLEEESRNLYERFKTKREKQILIDVLKVVNPKIVNIEFRERFDGLNSFFLISFDDEEDFVKLNNLGDGFKRIFYIILKTISLQGKRILIDEIEIGIHYSKMKNFWVNIIKVCKELDVQLFATTHSDECIKAFVDASESISESIDKMRMIQLQEHKGKMYASTFLHKHIKSGLDSNLKMLG